MTPRSRRHPTTAPQPLAGGLLPAGGPGGRRAGRRSGHPALRVGRPLRPGAAAPRHLRRARRQLLARRLRRVARTRLWLGIECGLLFLGVPLALWTALRLGYSIPVIPVLLVVTGLIGLNLSRDRYFDRRVLRAFQGVRREGPRILATFAAGAALLALGVALLTPERLFDLPRERFGLWAAVMVFYPLLSVLPQEVLYRAFFFHRYRPLFGNRRLTVIASALAFGFVHVVYGAWISVGLTTVGGLLFGYTYLKTRSVLVVGIEHALYGCFLFTIGLGRFFYHGG